MKFRDVIGFSLQLVLPDKAISALERISQFAPPVQPSNDAPPAQTSTNTKSESVCLIEELDSAQFGGPSFGEQSISVMAGALDDALATLPSPIEKSRMRELAQKVLNCAADGERNQVRLRQAALAGLVAPQSEPTTASDL
jgi:hypothetical protein